MLGSEPEFGEHTTWFHPCWREVEEPEKLPPISLNPANRWYVRQFELLRESRWLAGDDYAVGSPDLVEGLDVLASLRGTEGVLLDMVERPAWVQEKVMEINRARIAAFDACHTFCCTADNWTFHTSFKLVGPGKTDKLQCDLSAMFGPAMFQEFCVPHLTEQCRLCDHTMFHLDGSQCLCHLDLLLGIEDLGAIEWSPDPQVPSCADRRWWDMYRRIRAAGKSVQAINLQVHEVAPLLDGAGPEGMYLLVDVKDWREAEELEKVVARYATQ